MDGQQTDDAVRTAEYRPTSRKGSIMQRPLKDRVAAGKQQPNQFAHEGTAVGPPVLKKAEQTFGKHCFSLLSLALLAMLGCGTADVPMAADTPSEVPPIQQAFEPTSATNAEKPVVEKPTGKKPTVAVAKILSKLKFKGADGEVSYSLKPEADGAKLVDANEREIARFTVDQNKLKIKDAADVVLGYVIFADNHFKIKNADQTQELFKLQAQSDGDWKLEDGRGKLIYKIKKRDYGFEIEDDKDNSHSKAKLKSGKTSLRNRAEETVLYTKDEINTLAFASMGFEALKSQPLQAGLMTMVLLHSP